MKELRRGSRPGVSAKHYPAKKDNTAGAQYYNRPERKCIIEKRSVAGRPIETRPRYPHAPPPPRAFPPPSSSSFPPPSPPINTRLAATLRPLGTGTDHRDDTRRARNPRTWSIHAATKFPLPRPSATLRRTSSPSLSSSPSKGRSSRPDRRPFRAIARNTRANARQNVIANCNADSRTDPDSVLAPSLSPRCRGLFAAFTWRATFVLCLRGD
jgi:hypothetical protein